LTAGPEVTGIPPELQPAIIRQLARQIIEGFNLVIISNLVILIVNYKNSVPKPTLK
jgi:hypothetical protein